MKALVRSPARDHAFLGACKNTKLLYFWHVLVCIWVSRKTFWGVFSGFEGFRILYRDGMILSINLIPYSAARVLRLACFSYVVGYLSCGDTGSPRAFRKESPGAGPPESRKSAPRSLKRVRKESKTSLFGLFSDSFETPGRTLSGLQGSRSGGLFRDSFRTLPGFRAHTF